MNENEARMVIEIAGKFYPTIGDLLKVPEWQRNGRDYIESKSGIFLITSSKIKTSSNGNKYSEALAVDSKAKSQVKIWDVVKGGSLVFAHYEYSSSYRSFSLEPVKIVDAVSVPDVTEKLIPHYEGIEELKRCLEYFIKSVKNEYLRSLLEVIFDKNGDFYGRFVESTAASRNHHVGRGGLLFHTISVAKNAANLLSNYPSIDRDLVVTGCLIHDIGKVETYTFGTEFSYTSDGKLENHVVIGIKMLARFIDKIPGFPKDLEMILSHMVASHHGSLEYGSPVVPKTPEAMLVHFADEMDAKLRAAIDALENVSDNNWSERIGFLGTDFFKFKEEES